MDYYNDVYRKRLNRYGNNYETRVQGHREREFEIYLNKSIYRIDFIYNNTTHPASFEPYKEDYTRTQHYLLTRVDLDMPNGTILNLPNKDGVLEPWMVWWKEIIEASGYNRYVMLRLSHQINWVDQNNILHQQWGYFYGPGTTKIDDSIKSRNGTRGGNIYYLENDNLYMLITPFNADLKKTDYFEIITATVTNAYNVVNIDMTSTAGIMYVSIDPIYIRDHNPIPTQRETDPDEDFYWLNQGGFNNGNT